mmetsp:Transcript_39817/g.100363  ORF Transcript_39817/g.100363 Transcript_39817/m.100363 type:complete len:150 (+) Transcript_39817:72-521(+)
MRVALVVLSIIALLALFPANGNGELTIGKVVNFFAMREKFPERARAARATLDCNESDVADLQDEIIAYGKEKCGSTPNTEKCCDIAKNIVDEIQDLSDDCKKYAQNTYSSSELDAISSNLEDHCDNVEDAAAATTASIALIACALVLLI